MNHDSAASVPFVNIRIRACNPRHCPSDKNIRGIFVQVFTEAVVIRIDRYREKAGSLCRLHVFVVGTGMVYQLANEVVPSPHRIGRKRCSTPHEAKIATRGYTAQLCKVMGKVGLLLSFCYICSFNSNFSS